MIMALGSPVKRGEAVVYAFPNVERFQAADDDVLRAAGLSANKLATLHRAADALASGSLDEGMLEERPSPDAAEILCGIKGIGPWTATVILLRGLGRLDVFPMRDSSVARNLQFVAGAAAVDMDRVLTELGTQRGMLYYHLLLARLDTRDEVGRPSFT
jgi:DNA-3-methyladenine glycosylase II